MTDHQVKLLFKLVDGKKMTIKTAAAKAGMSEPTAHKYLRLGKLLSELMTPRCRRTRLDAFVGVWQEAEVFCGTIHSRRQRHFLITLRGGVPGNFIGTLRTFQRAGSSGPSGPHLP